MNAHDKLKAYERMYLLRKMEEELVEYYRLHKVMSFVHFYIGQEAVAVGVCDALEHEDRVFGNHRSHGHYLAKGGDPAKMVAECLGKVTGCCRGKGGSMHMIDKSVNFIGSTPILGSVAPISAGSALQQKLTGSPNITVAFYGDGASEEGVVYETMNFSALFKLPLLLVVENNFYSVMSRLKDRRSEHYDLQKIAEGFGLKYLRADGNDYLDVAGKARQAVDLIKNHNQSVVMECITFRHMAHSAPIKDDAAGYREVDTVDYRNREDSVFRMRLDLLSSFSEEDIFQVEQGVNQVVAEAIAFGSNSPYPPQEELYKDVYHE